ncbi:hypothetical protein GTY81_03990 [Streptomyces sp. SID8366]|uniref:hypothetical protein n=1 Tax=unclassified Streptomyces TaxID=2593676 RepID=UPI000DB9BE70|nr:MULTISPECIES: hypothetical protein [unclassified Streptomyces]MYU03071.1 hypothetical protein [Streptomyces sp. SID8366]MYU68140.1 hypothetical protein [Streptomyces sp. SID69]RAJ56979.1 hypothetical protein K376_03862 [Streptomyces sp. PsTaAH-130]
MTDTPGWASPGSDPTPEGREPGASDTADQPANGSGAPAPQPGPQPQAPGAQWSGQQPPPGQWSTPTGAPGQTPPPGPGWGGPRPGTPGGGYGGPPGYGAPAYGVPGGYGTWGGGWGGPPPAAKPGVIPLRPLGVGEILDGAVSTLRTYWRTVLGISLALAVVTQVIAVLLQGYFLNRTAAKTSLGDPAMPPGEALRVMGESFLSSFALGLITLIGTLIATAMLTSVTSRAVLGRPATLGEAWREARPQLLKLFGQMLLLGLLGVGIMLVASVPGVIGFLAGSRIAGTALLLLGFVAGGVVSMWLMVRFSLAAPALMLEKQGIMHSLRRSAKLVHGSWWRILGIQLLSGLIVGVVRVVISIPFTLIALIASDDGLSSLLGQNGGHVGWTFLLIVGIGAVIGTTITLPISACVTVFLYIDQRIRREGLDLELARAAGVQGTPAPAGAAPGPVPGS